MDKMTSKLNPPPTLAEIKTAIASKTPLSASQLSFLRHTASHGDEGASEVAMQIMKLDPWSTMISTQDARWLETLYDKSHSYWVKVYALRLLCGYLSEATRQKNRILPCLERFNETDFDLLLAACSSASELLTETADQKVLRALLVVMRSNLHGANETARNAVLRASGMTSRDIILLKQASGEPELWAKAELAAEILTTR
jgi:hypothetical protein